jgi:DNA mismatch endonuclease, patch repair protein
MADRLSKARRSWLMSRIPSKGNHKTEARFIGILRRAKIKGWRRQYHVEGKPDVAFPERKVAIFVDGCFWHGCSRCSKRSKTNTNFWDEKFRRNRLRDRRVTRRLRATGWQVLRLWEHELKHESKIAARISRALFCDRQRPMSSAV